MSGDVRVLLEAWLLRNGLEDSDDLSRMTRAFLQTDPNAKPRWKCPCCESTNVQISFPTWYHETVTGKDQAGADLEFVETDAEADILWWYCENCEESDSGSPVEVEYP